MDILKKIAQTFAYIVTGITISTAIFTTLFAKGVSFSPSLLWQIITMSLICSLGNLIYCSKKELSKSQMKYRIILHFFYINFIVFAGAVIWGWMDHEHFLEFLSLFVLIAVVYTSIMIIGFKQELKSAEMIDRQLRKRFHAEEED